MNISDALSGYTKIYDDYGNVYMLKNTGTICSTSKMG